MSEHYETIAFNNAREFLNAHRRSDPRWLAGDASLTPWVFRGQGCAEWDLTPSAWRPTVRSDSHFQATLFSISDADVEEVISDNKSLFGNREINPEAVRLQVTQRRFEFLQVQAFTSIADELGMHIPGGFISYTISHDLLENEFSFDSPHPAYALAQHHGMATRLLDWTQNPLYAAFFAAENPEELEGAIAVWALNTQVLIGKQWTEYRVPRSLIGFLHSQAGLFTYHRLADADFVFSGKWPAIEQICSPETLKKLTLPSSEAKELRRLLFAEGVSRVHLMPTFDNIKNTLNKIWEEMHD